MINDLILNSHPNEIVKEGLEFIKYNDFLKATKLILFLVKKDHFKQAYRLTIKLIPNVINNKNNFIDKISNELFKKNQFDYLKKISKQIINSTNNSQHESILNIKKLMNNKPNKRIGELKVNELIEYKNFRDLNTSKGVPNPVSNDEIVAFNKYYLSFFKKDIKSFLIKNEEESFLGNYQINITKNHIDLRKLEPNYEKRYLYDFNSSTLSIENKEKDATYLRMFYDMMARVSKDIKYGRSIFFEVH